MKTNKSHLAIVPARSGSKRLPGKNIIPLGGIPLLAWTIKTAHASGIFSRVILSADDEEYAAIGIDYGADVPWLRPATLASDNTPTSAVIVDLLDRLMEMGDHYDRFTLLQPTSPLRSAHDLREAQRLMNERDADAVVGVVRCEHPPQWSNSLPADGSLNDFISREAMVPGTELTPKYRINGALYMADAASFKTHRHFYTPRSVAYVMPRERSVDIDESLDLLLAGCIINQKNYIEPWTT
jgi:CMP-N,N'-diacetyllegionaminic acid synthase